MLRFKVVVALVARKSHPLLSMSTTGDRSFQFLFEVDEKLSKKATSCADDDTAIYSSSTIVDRATVGCSLMLHAITNPSIMATTYLVRAWATGISVS